MVNINENRTASRQDKIPLMNVGDRPKTMEQDNHTEDSVSTASNNGTTSTHISPPSPNITSITIGSSPTYNKIEFFPSDTRRNNGTPSNSSHVGPYATTVILQESNGWVRASTPVDRYNTRLENKERPDTWSVCSKPVLPSLSEDHVLDDGQRSTSTIIGSTKMTRDRVVQRRRTSFVSGLTIVMSAAIFLRLPGILAIYNPGSFLAAYSVCLLFVVVPLAFLEAGLGQFSSNGAIGTWSLVPFARGVGWAAVMVCLFWGATAAGLGAPWLHYMLAYFKSEILPVLDEHCSWSANTTDHLQYYRECVYNYASLSEGTLDVRLTWPLPVGVTAIFFMGLLGALRGPFLYTAVSCLSSFLALAGGVAQLSVVIYYFVATDSYQSLPGELLAAFKPDIDSFANSELWLCAMSQALITMGTGLGLLMTHSSKSIFRFPMKRKLAALTFVAILFTMWVSLTTVLQNMIVEKHLENTTDLTLSQELVMEDLNFMNEEITIWKPQPLLMKDSSVYNFEDHSAEGIPFVGPLVVLRLVQIQNHYWNNILVCIILVGLFGASSATLCSVLDVIFVAARETLSLPPAASTILMLLMLCLLILSTITKAGAVVLHLLNFYVLNVVVLWPSLLSIVALAYFHGITKIRKDLTFMLESRVTVIWMMFWAAIVPCALLGITVWAFVTSWDSLSMNWAVPWQGCFVWVLRICVIAPIPLTAVLVVKSQLAYGLKDKLLAAFQSSREWGDWGPKDPIEHHNWRRWREDETRSYASLERRLVSRPLTYTHSTLSSVGSSTLSRLRSKYKARPPASSL